MTNPDPTAPAIRCAGLTHAFGDHQVLRGIDLAVEPGSVFALLGPNGAGKTTTVRILTTLLTPDGGAATVAGLDVVRERAQVKRRISVTGQYAALDDLLDGRENLVLIGRLNHLGRGARRRADELIERFDLATVADRPVKTWSGGTRRRLDLAVSLVNRPDVLFLDEPTTGLDPAARLTMWEVIRELVGQGTTIFLTTQYLDEADQLADRIAVLADGTIVAEGRADELKARIPGEQVVLTFADDADLDRARAVVAGIDAVDRAARRIEVGTDGSPAAVRSLLDRLHAAAVPVEGLALRPPTLDDVFLLLTGHTTATSGDAPDRHAVSA